jgi:hypothetical protein
MTDRDQPQDGQRPNDWVDMKHHKIKGSYGADLAGLVFVARIGKEKERE